MIYERFEYMKVERRNYDLDKRLYYITERGRKLLYPHTIHIVRSLILYRINIYAQT
jgi:hypothetical protein